MPWLDPEKVGPFRPGTTSTRSSSSRLPTLLIVSAIFFALATATRSMMWTYVGAVALLVLLRLRGLLRDPQHDTLVALTDPFGSARCRSSPSTGRRPTATASCPRSPA